LPEREAAVLAAFEALFEALADRRDAEAGSVLFADDDDVAMWGSEEAEQAVGPAAIAALHRAIAASPTRLAFEWERRLVHVEGDAAWVSAAGTVRVERPGEAPRVIPYRAIAVMVRRGGGWRWHTFSASEPT
jgi:ketosteroid isomerase-like protein